MTQSETAQDVQHRVLDEEAAWEQAATSILGTDAELLSVSRYIGDSRVYRSGDRLAKIRSLDATLPPGVSRLDAEAEILKRLGQEITYMATDTREALLFSHIDGVPLDQLLPTLSFARRARLLLRLVPELRRLHTRGVAHRDLRLDNVLVDADGRPRLIDFDRAAVGGTWSVGMADALGIAPSGLSANPYWKLALYTIAPKTQSLARRLRALVTRPAPLRNGLEAEPDLQLLARAWSLAQRSSANAPGQRVAYYAFTYKGQHFPGERSWYLRWESIRRAVSFEGKRLIELGSNMGLLSSFAMIHGAKSATGVDYDRLIVDSARLVAE
ncbi:MAG: phosphotransferase, partial [Chloroflexi bacterium]|nr:phosphotransferase [Chloroflexota bacterium]